MEGLIVFYAPPDIKVAELSVLVALLFLIKAPLFISVPKEYEGHVLPGIHHPGDLLEIREFIAEIPAS
jgi:hypothetical protein